MILIRRRREDIPQEWLNRAEAVTRKLREAADDPEKNDDGSPRSNRELARQKRKKIIKENEGLWQELKAILESWSYEKCWYSEAREIGSDYHMDHFRPKNRVMEHVECPGNGRPDEGYWWVAFDWENYRLSAGFCNSPHKVGDETLGKWDYFPLLTMEGVALSPDDPLAEERPLLLDPVRLVDTTLISFNEQGEAVPANPAIQHQAWRVRLAIKILNLNSPKLCEARRRTWRETSDILEGIIRLMAVPNEKQDRYREAEIEDRLRQLGPKTAPDRELCGAARAAVKKSFYDWASDWLAPLDGSVLEDPERWAAPKAPAQSAAVVPASNLPLTATSGVSGSPTSSPSNPAVAPTGAAVLPFLETLPAAGTASNPPHARRRSRRSGR